MFKATLMRSSGYRFSATESDQTHTDKMRGLAKFGPYRSLDKEPRIGFVFPTGYNSQANDLFLALRNGIGYFKGLPSLFNVQFNKDQVFPISGFSLTNPHDHEKAATQYRDAIMAWCAKDSVKPDLFIVLHPRSLGWEEDSAYAACKAVLLNEGIVSQNVTFDLISNPSQFEWAAANIALAIFVKLGGIPWVSNIAQDENSVVLGMDRSEDYDPISRQTKAYTAFTTCLREDGVFRFANFGKVCSDRTEYLSSLGITLTSALEMASQDGHQLNALTFHFPKDYSCDEIGVVNDVMAKYETDRPPQIHRVKVSQEDHFFAVDDSTSGIPPRGTCIALGPRQYLLYTEGGDEKSTWSMRTPGAVRLKHLTEPSEADHKDLVSQIFDLSLVNWRGFKAKAFPVSIAYSELIARILKRGAIPQLSDEKLNTRLWFL